MKLSDSFLAPPKENSIELVVNFINLNYNKDNEILQKSPSLLGYSKLLYYIKEEAKENGGDLKKAIDASVKQCMDEGLIEDFLRKHSREVTGMLFNEITVEEFAEIRAREAYEDGEKSGFLMGEKSGYNIGEAAGLLKGAEQKQLEIARNFLNRPKTSLPVSQHSMVYSPVNAERNTSCPVKSERSRARIHRKDCEDPLTWQSCGLCAPLTQQYTESLPEG